MKKSVKILLILGAVLIIAGLGIFTAAMSMLNWDFSKLSTADYETVVFDISEEFEDMNIDIDYGNIIIKASENDKCKVVSFKEKDVEYSTDVSDKTLIVKSEDTRNWYDHISLFNFNSPVTTVYLPKKSYSSFIISTDTGNAEVPEGFTFKSIDITGKTGNVNCCADSEEKTEIITSTGSITVKGTKTKTMSLSVTTGSIDAENISCSKSLTANVSTGDVCINDAECGSLTSKGSTGSLTLKSVIATGTFDFERSTGGIFFDSCDAADITVRTGTGDVKGSLLSEKVFITDTSTGDVDVPKSISGGKCEITTGTGDINIKIQE